jgi:hypothetical protein
MGATAKVLGQAAPSATTETTLYTVPASTSAVVSTLTVCNRSATATTFRISITVGGGATADKDYLYYDTPIGGNDCFQDTAGITLATTDKIKVYATLATLSFQAFGQELT